MRIAALVLAVLPVTAASAGWTPALERETTAAYGRCMKTGPAAYGNDPAMLDCGYAEQARQDQRLNAIYRATMARLGPAGKQRLRASERAWIKARDAQCDPIYASGGTAAKLNGSGCLLELTIRRRLWLARYR